MFTNGSDSLLNQFLWKGQTKGEFGKELTHFFLPKLANVTRMETNDKQRYSCFFDVVEAMIHALLTRRRSDEMKMQEEVKVFLVLGE